LAEENVIQSENLAREADARGALLFRAGRFREALAEFTTAVALRPKNVDFRYNLSCTAWALGDLSRTRAELQKIIEQDSNYSKAHDALARLLHEAGELSAADVHSARAVELNALEAEFALTRAVVLVSLGRSAEAWDVLGPALPSEITADRAAAINAKIAPALQRETEATSIVADALARPAQRSDFRRQLHFAAAGLFDRMGRYDDAFAQATAAHQIATKAYDPVARARDFELRIGHWTAPKISSLTRATHGSTRPVFIVGMPRSGTTLVEQILGCHPQVYPAGELDAMNRTARALNASGLPYPQSLEALTPPEANRIASVYLDYIGRLNATARYVTDKMPLNFIYLDLIAVLFPDCHVIHCTRDPLDTCLSCYMTEFETPYDFAENLLDLGSFYGLYRALMDHWRSVLPVKILDVRYENVVSDLEVETRRMLDFLTLDWDPRCLEFHQSGRVANTASREQVKRPIYPTSVGRWKHYERHLGALRESLRESALTPASKHL